MKLDLGHIALNVVEDGDPAGAPVVFSNSLGTTLEVWDKVIPLLPQNLRLIRYDMRGHGASDVPDAPYSMGALIRDAEALLDHLKVRDCVFVGLSIGGMIAQGLATKRLDQIRAMVLSNSAAKLGNADMWHKRMRAIQADGLEAMADEVMARWFSPAFRKTPELTLWRKMLTDTPEQGYLGACAAIAGTDFYTTTAALTLPTLAIAGSEDRAAPPDLVRETAGIIKGSRFELIRGAGHLPCVDKPEEFSALLSQFLRDIGHT
ncbi:3-oxoadipate enol-lactonase [Litoreibacter arenae]|uniref:Beta-ketoadipate enol-lactone hydrolase n=1 Tax=Litoreibacter arenae DSM 19593 TaxID=1123360 RepID=S9QQ01_9RHOB|nr:3-oxoadipate enol-lactonase [Litoreibacter arenae]EPX81683.1 Beta-ketoadipate enol-lactone hydrolase [Litoreibacter arenae DSM 19593]